MGKLEEWLSGKPVKAPFLQTPDKLTPEKISPEIKVSISENPIEPLRPIIKFYTIESIYTRIVPQHDVLGTLAKSKREFRLFKALTDENSQPYIVFDIDGQVNLRKLQYAAANISSEVLERFKNEVPIDVLRKFSRRSEYLKNEEAYERLDELYKKGFLINPVPILRNLEILKKFGESFWRDYVEDIINFRRVLMDERLKLVRRCTLLKGIRQNINPHSIIVLPGQTGKSDHYHYVGICEDKVSANSLVGYATTDGPFPGSLDNSELPFGIDQLESQSMYKIFKYLLSLMELGEALIDMAAHPFTIHTLSPMLIFSNPVGDSRSNFGTLIRKMSANPTLGRRFGIILYDSSAVIIKDREKNLDQLINIITLFRAIEEHCRSDLRKIVENPKVWDWLNLRNEETTKQELALIDRLKYESEGTHLFLQEFVINGGAHTRGAALSAALAMNLDKIALKTYDIDAILAEAEEYLSDLMKINFQSLQNIIPTIQQSKEDERLRCFDTLPEYLKDIVKAVEAWRRALTKTKTTVQIPFELHLNILNYTPKSRYFSQSLLLARQSNPEKHNEELKNYFGFDLIKDDHSLIATVYSLEYCLENEVQTNADS